MTRFLALFRRRKPLKVILEDAARAHYRREGVDPAEVIEAVRALDGDTSVPKRPSVYVEGL